MKKILIATDFSDAAKNAAFYGIKLAEAMRAEIVLFHAYKTVPALPEATVLVTPEEMNLISKTRLKEEVAIINADRTVNVRTACEEGATGETILNAAEDWDANLIIAGKKGEGKAFRKLFGSTITYLLNNSSIPVLAVPEVVSFKPPVTIVFASDLLPYSDMKVFEVLRSVGEKFNSMIYILRVSRNKEEEVFSFLNRPTRLEGYLGNVGHQFEFKQDKSIAHGLSVFLTESGANLLVMVPHRDSKISNWLKKSQTKKMLFEIDIPLLIVPERKYEYASLPKKKFEKKNDKADFKMKISM